MKENNTNQPQEDGMVDINVFLKDPALVKKLNNKINAYNLRPHPKEGLRYRRTPEDNIISAGNFNAMWFIDEFLKITSKTSTLPRSIRTCVEVYVVTSMQELYYEDMKKQAKENKDVSKKESGSKGAHTK